MINEKVYPSFEAAVADIPDGATIMVGGFGGPAGIPQNLVVALRDQGAKDLTIIHNTGGFGLSGIGYAAPGDVTYSDHSVLIANRQVKKVYASYPFPPPPSASSPFKEQYLVGEVELEIVPQGTLAERIRAGGAGIGAFYTPTGVGTEVAEGKEQKVINGKIHILEYVLKADYALIRAHKADTMGNLVYRGTARTFNPVMATAATITIAEVDEIVEPGALDPEHIITPFVYVDRIVEIPKEGLE
ncbi:MAG: CoA transferase subunit A [Dehalococcoidia bacterium]|nr:CoA transferase subunit A [Dehalococcoidia bacterium]